MYTLRELCVHSVHYSIMTCTADDFPRNYSGLEKHNLKGLLHGYEWGLRFGGLELRFG